MIDVGLLFVVVVLLIGLRRLRKSRRPKLRAVPRPNRIPYESDTFRK